MNAFKQALVGTYTASDTVIELNSISDTVGDPDYLVSGVPLILYDSLFGNPADSNNAGDYEIVLVTDVNYATNEITVTRAQENTTAQTISAGWSAVYGLTQAGLDAKLDVTQYEATKGKVLQVVFAETETAVSVTTTTWTDTSLTASITPESATSKIVVMVSQATQVGRNNDSAFGGIRLLRGATVIHNPNPEDATGPFGFGRSAGGSGTTSLTHYGTIALSKEDSPATGSEVTYKTQGRPYETSGSGLIRFQRNEAESNAKSTMILMEIEPNE